MNQKVCTVAGTALKVAGASAAAVGVVALGVVLRQLMQNFAKSKKKTK